MNAAQRAARRGYVFKRVNDTVALIELRKIRRETDHELRERHPEKQAPAPMGWVRRHNAHKAQGTCTRRQFRRLYKKARKAGEV